MYDHSLHCGKKHFCHYCLHVFIIEEILKCHIKDYFKINSKQRIIMPKKGEYITFKNYERKIKSLLIIYADFESILALENNGKQNPEESCSSKYQKHKLVCVDDKFNKHFKTYLGKDTIYNFINSIIKESKYCSDLMKKHFKRTCDD